MQGNTNILWTNTAAALNDYGKAVRDKYRENLTDNKRPTQRNTLVSSAEYVVEVGELSFEVSLRLQDYWKYVEYGTKPHWPPPSAISEWITVKPVLPRPMKNGKLPTIKQLSYLIGRKIAQKGTKGTNDLEDAIEELNEIYLVKIDAAIEQDVRNHVDVLLTMDNNKPTRIL